MNTPYSAWALTDCIGHAHALLGAVVEKHVETHGLTRAQAIALGVLSEFPQGISQSEWARLQGVTRQHAYAIAHRLESEGWIAANRVGRERIVSLSKSGTKAVISIRPAMELLLQNALSGLTVREGKDLFALLEKLIMSVNRQEIA